MPWYYAQSNQRFGPYTDAEFSNIVAQGTVAMDTLVWRDGMQNWVPYSQVQTTVPPSGAGAPSPAREYTAPSGDQPMVVCSSCHRTFPQDEVIQYQGAYVCATCKPVFVQRLREGASLAGEMRYAGFWIRFAARIVDGIIMGLPLGILMMVIIFAAIGSSEFDPNNPAPPALFGLVQLASIFVPILYDTFFIGRFGATPGKMACGLRVVTSDGQRVTYLRAFGRYWGVFLSGLTLYIGFIIAAFDNEKRALHDHICNTRVIRV